MVCDIMFLLRNLCRKKEKKKKTASAPTLVLFERCHSFKGLGFAHTAEMQRSTLATHTQCSLNVNTYQIAHSPATKCQLIRNKRLISAITLSGEIIFLFLDILQHLNSKRKKKKERNCTK